MEMPQKDRNLGISHKRIKNVYQQNTQMQFMCRVCLTRSNSLMYDLNNNSILSEENVFARNEIISIHQALQKVTSSKISLYEDCPHYICPICFNILKISLKFIYQFEESQNKLKELFGDNSLCMSQDCETSQYNLVHYQNQQNMNNSAHVELIYGNSKYNLDDLLVVERTEEENYDFNGFLNNLGKEVIATFADKSDHKLHRRMEDTNGQVTISLVGKDKVQPVKELQLDEETNTIKCVLVENYISESEEEILKLEIHSDDSDTNENLKDIDIDAFIVEHNIEEMDLESLNQRKKVAQTLKDGTAIALDEDIFKKEVCYPCDICKEVFDFPHRLKAHKRKHSNKLKVYSCDICGYKNNTLSGHNYHKSKHKGKRWVCQVCNKCYYTKAVLQVHMESHHNKRQHLCTVCGKGFNYANALIYHMRLHTGEKNYNCKYCNQKFRMSNSLQRHLRCHTGERPYQCQYCDKAFRSKGELNCHESGHTGRRPYHCRYCEKGFTKTHNLKLHLLSHGGPHRCELCGRNFIEGSILTMHYRISHKVVEERMENTEEDSN